MDGVGVLDEVFEGEDWFGDARIVSDLDMSAAIAR